MRIRNVPGERSGLTNTVALLSLCGVGLTLAQAAIAEGRVLEPPLSVHGVAGRLSTPRPPMEH